MKLLVPVVLTLVGVGAGVGAGVALRPGPQQDDAHASSEAQAAAAADDAHAPAAGAHGKAADGHGSGTGGAEFVSFGSQFIVPILDGNRVESLVVLSIDVETAPGQSEAVYRLEPKLRDAFLTVLFDHANAGGFDGTFTSSGAMDTLRAALREAGRKAVGDLLSQVLITSIVRQDMR